MTVRVFLVAMTTKIIERAPVNFAIVKALSCLNPKLISNNQILSEKRMETLLQFLHESNILPALSADRAKQQFSEFSNRVNKEWKKAFSEFSDIKSLDAFYYQYLHGKEEFKDLWTVVRIVMTLSHGNASPESGFSINKDILVENMQETSLVALRTIYDAVKSQGGPLSEKVTPEMLQHVKMSRSRYHLALEEKKTEEAKGDKAEIERKRALAQIKVLQQKRARLATDVQLEQQKMFNKCK